MHNLNVGNRRARRNRRQAMHGVVERFNEALRSGDFVAHRVSCDRGVVTNLDGIAVSHTERQLVLTGSGWSVVQRIESDRSLRTLSYTPADYRIYCRFARPAGPYRRLCDFIDRVRLDDREIHGYRAPGAVLV